MTEQELDALERLHKAAGPLRNDTLTVDEIAGRRAMLDAFPALLAAAREANRLAKDAASAAELLRGLLLSADAMWEEKNMGHDWREACVAARAFLVERRNARRLLEGE